MSRTQRIVILVFGWFCVIPLSAEQDACQQRTVIVSLGTKDGTPIPELARTNLEGTCRKKPVDITSAIFNQDPPRVILLLDIRGSMDNSTSNFDRNLSQNVAENLISSLPPDSEIGLGFFYKEFTPVALPSTNRTILKLQMEALRSHPASFRGKTALWTGILKAVKMFNHPHSGDAIYVITDGGDNASDTTMKHVVQTLRELDIRLFAFVFRRLAGASPEEQLGLGSVLEAVEETGGTIISLQDDIRGDFSGVHGSADIYKSGRLTEFGSRLGSQYRQISNFYRVQINLPERVDKSQDWRLDLAGFSKSQRDKLVLRYPHKFVPCH